MSTGTKIEWTHHTFNPWWGCTKVHAGCTNCYAEALDKRWGGDHWGNGPRRMVLGEWGKPAKWNAEAQAAGERRRVFCASMCDLFEDHKGEVVDQQGKPVPLPHSPGVWTVPHLRTRVFHLVEATPWLDWLMLTKRPENINDMVPSRWHDEWPANVMTGTSPCNQETADKCIPALLKVPGRHFLSCEPLIGPLLLADLEREYEDGQAFDWLGGGGIDWVIVGGESGRKSRQFHIGWAHSIVEQCKAVGVPVFVKQLGAQPIRDPSCPGESCFVDLKDPKGGDMSEWPKALRVREFPTFQGPEERG